MKLNFWKEINKVNTKAFYEAIKQTEMYHSWLMQKWEEQTVFIGSFYILAFSPHHFLF